MCLIHSGHRRPDSQVLHNKYEEARNRPHQSYLKAFALLIAQLGLIQLQDVLKQTTDFANTDQTDDWSLQASSLDPRIPIVRLTEGFINMFKDKQQQYESAKRTFQNALELLNENPLIESGVTGLADFLLGSYEAGLTHFRNILRRFHGAIPLVIGQSLLAQRKLAWRWSAACRFCPTTPSCSLRSQRSI
jgi:tetratricopeptide (TPR) repeat protein